MSRPRAAISVATRMADLPCLNSSSAWVRSFWLRSLWIAVAGNPSFCNWRATRSASRFIRVNISTCFMSRERTRCANSAPFFNLATSNTWWVTSSAGALRRATSIIVGLRMNCSARRLISLEKVAENSKFWRTGGSTARMRSISGIKPMSSIRSASSSTSIPTCDRLILFC